MDLSVHTSGGAAVKAARWVGGWASTAVFLVSGLGVRSVGAPRALVPPL